MATGTPRRRALAAVLWLGLAGSALAEEATAPAASPPVSTTAAPTADASPATALPDTSTAAPTVEVPVAASPADQQRAREEATRAARRAGEATVAMRERQVTAIETDFSGFDARLVPALTGLGQALHEVRRDKEALEVLERAQHVSRVNDGLYNLDQIPVLDVIARVQSALGQWPDAVRAKEYALQLVRRAYGADSPELVGQLYEMAGWYESVGHVFGARQAYERAAVIIDARLGAADPKRAEALRKLAHSYRLERFPEHRLRADEQRYVVDFGALPNVGSERRVSTLNRFGPGEAALKEAIRIYQRQQPIATADTADTLVELGDWYLLFDRFDLAMLAYREAHAQALSTPERADDLFAQPQPVYFRAPVVPERPPVDAINEYRGFVEMAFDVSERGEIVNVQLVNSSPQGLLTEPALEAMRQARYRPQLDARGQPMAATNQHYRFEFPYYTPALPESGS